MTRFAHVLMRLMAAGIFTAFMSLSSAVPTTAQETNGFQHFMDCLGWMFSNPSEHATNCSPGHDWTGPFTRAWGYEGPQAPTTSCTPVPGAFHETGPYEPQILPVVSCCPTDDDASSVAYTPESDQAFVWQVQSCGDDSSGDDDDDDDDDNA